ncbi:MAG: toprim domain-containing protein, partial [Anaerolineae bacterium]|nr:toprim domain-containing protein [Anaerolineae bacterium]
QARLWRCPFHQERRGFSLAVWPDHWRCYGACQMHGDAIDWLMRYRGMIFAEACEYLDGNRTPVSRPKVARAISAGLVEAKPPEEAWQEHARTVVWRAERTLWSDIGFMARSYLLNRGLTPETIRRAHLGYVPGHWNVWRHVDGLRVPCGITSPWLDGDAVLAVKVRRLGGNTKYVQIPGGSAHGLYNAASLADHDVALFVEGEFDALVAEQEVGDMVGVATLGSATGKLADNWISHLMHCKRILVAYDADDAGRKGAAYWQSLTRRAVVVTLPFGKDITEFVKQGGNVKQWLSEFV